ncbi:hypothetical protein KPATCC21470_2692 [Kitasatospora purpeofusca]
MRTSPGSCRERRPGPLGAVCLSVCLPSDRSDGRAPDDPRTGRRTADAPPVRRRFA